MVNWKNTKEVPVADEKKGGVAERAAAAGRDLLEKMRDYVEVGAAEASRLTSTARMRVDLETARFRRSLLFKDLGKRTFAAWDKKKAEAFPGTEPLLREIRDIDEEIIELSRRIADVGGAEEEPESRPRRKGR
jgi:hypothetical protein